MGKNIFIQEGLSIKGALKQLDKSTQKFLINDNFSIKQAMKQLSDIGQKTLFVIDSEGEGVLLGALSDGDIRKHILAGGSLKESIKKKYNKKPKFVYQDYQLRDVKNLMLTLLIEHVPVIDNNRKILKILSWEDIFSDTVPRAKNQIETQVIIMAGGKGTRLDPFTKILPKSLIPIGEKPIIEIIMDKFNEQGVKEFFLSVNSKARMIKAYFEDVSGKYKIHYIEEKKPLGTAGGLRLLKNKVKDPFIVTNCDTIIESDSAEIVKLHNDKNYDITLVVSCRHYIIPYGICEIENGGILKHINEKPEYDLLVNTGMYVMKKRVLDLIPRNKFFNINELILKAKNNHYEIGVFPISEHSWIDIGQWEEYRKAIEKMRID